MKLVHKVLYSLFGFFVCAFNAKATHAALGGCGKITGSHQITFPIRNSSAGTMSFFCCKAAPGEYCGSNHASNTCSGDFCETLWNGTKTGVCVSYESVWGLNLYGCAIESFGCTGEQYWDGIDCNDCTGAYTPCRENPYSVHQTNTCQTGCSQNYYYDSTVQACVDCPVYEFMSPDMVLQQFTAKTNGCAVLSSATASRCYVTGQGQDQKGTFEITNECYYK